MSDLFLERLLECIGEVDDFFLEEAESADIARAKADKRKRIAKYSAYGAAGLAVSVGIGLAAAYWRSRRRRGAKVA